MEPRDRMPKLPFRHSPAHQTNCSSYNRPLYFPPDFEHLEVAISKQESRNQRWRVGASGIQRSHITQYSFSIELEPRAVDDLHPLFF